MHLGEMHDRYDCPLDPDYMVLRNLYVLCKEWQLVSRTSDIKPVERIKRNLGVTSGRVQSLTLALSCHALRCVANLLEMFTRISAIPSQG
jgi:hypothetical protein